MTRARPALLLAATAAATAAPLGAAAQEAPTATLDELVVTATRRAEPRSSIAGTVQVVDEETIRRSTAQNVTALLAEQGVGFFSEWTPAQTSINIRGGATDGQGRDFRSQVLVLVNGRRAGTANLSKLSPADVERIEIVRGPASVVYGSQAIGGVVNLILRDGRTSPGGFVEGAGGSWGLVEGRARYGGQVPGFDYYLGLSGGQRDSYRVGGGTRLPNTDWTRQGITGALGADLGPAGRLGVTLRSDGIYDAGFRGSAWSFGNRDDRSNASADLSLEGAAGDGRFRWNLQGYLVRDEDEFRWLSPVVRNAAGLPAPGTSRDFNFRRLDIAGARLQPVVRLWAGAEALVGLDVERSWLRSTRSRVNLPGGGTGQVALGTTVGQSGWDVTLLGVLRGPMFYNTEENLLVPQGEPFREFVHRKGAYWVWSLRGSVALLPDRLPGLRAFGAVNNIFDENYHPIFIATESLPYVSDPRFSNCGRGNSAPGREFIGGLRFAF